MTSNGLSKYISKLGGRHFRYRRGYKNVINKGIELNKEGVDCQLMMETRHGLSFNVGLRCCKDIRCASHGRYCVVSDMPILCSTSVLPQVTRLSSASGLCRGTFEGIGSRIRS